MTITATVGLQYGDEGKAKVFHHLIETSSHSKKIAIKFNGGPNAGHTVYKGNKKFVFHQLPSGLIVDNCTSVIMRGCVFDPAQFLKEIKEFGNDQAMVDKLCPVITQSMIDEDFHEFKNAIGTTGKGVGPTAASFFARDAILVQDLLDEKSLIEKVRFLNNNRKYKISESSYQKLIELGEGIERYVVDAKEYLLSEIDNHEMNDTLVAFEGSQGYSLDPFHGPYPYVTSTGCTVSYLKWALGIGDSDKIHTYGVFKPYFTYVGNNQNVDNEFDEDTSERIRELGGEYGATTGRPRRVGALDTKLLKEAIRANSVDSLVMTKYDLLADALRVDPDQFIENLEKDLNKQIKIISNGPSFDDMIFR